MSYNPKPPRVWSRVQNRCTFVDNDSYNTVSNDNVFVPLTGKTVSQFEADYQQQMFYKGNILQYKKNSSSLTKSQKYSQICKGAWINRTKSYATQTQTYTNPNLSNLQQVNFVNVPNPNGNTSFIPGPFNFNIPAPYGCTSNVIKEGGSLLCNTIVNPCTNEIVKTTNNDGTVCYPTYCSDVPGPIQDLCWNSKLSTWYPRENLTMNNSTDKWPEGYKGLVSAVSPIAPDAPYLMIDVSGNIATLTWNIIFNVCIPISSFNIYENGKIIANVPFTTASYNVLLNCGNNFFYVTAITAAFESGPSNIVGFNNLPFTTTGTVSYTVDSNCNYTVTFEGNGTIIFNNNNSVNYTVTSGGGNGGNGPAGSGSNSAGGGGGGGGGGTNTGNFVPTLNTLYTITVGTATLPSSISTITTSAAGSNGGNGNSSTGFGGAGGTGGAGTIAGSNGISGQNQQGLSGGAGGAGGAGYNGYGNGGAGGKGGDTSFGTGQSGSSGGRGVVILYLTG